MTLRDTDLKVYIDNSLIGNVDKFKYLGVWLDPALTWNEQIDKISKTTSKRNDLLRRLRNVLLRNTTTFQITVLGRFDSGWWRF